MSMSVVISMFRLLTLAECTEYCPSPSKNSLGPSQNVHQNMKAPQKVLYKGALKKIDNVIKGINANEEKIFVLSLEIVV